MHQPCQQQRDQAVEGGSGEWMLLSPLALPPAWGIRFGRLGKRHSVGDKARVIQTGPSAGRIIPKEECTQFVFKALQPIFPSWNNMHMEHVKGLKQCAEAEKAARAMDQEGVAFVSGKETASPARWPLTTRPVGFTDRLGSPGWGIPQAAGQRLLSRGDTHRVVHHGKEKEENFVFNFCSSYLPFGFTKLENQAKWSNSLFYL